MRTEPASRCERSVPEGESGGKDGSHLHTDGHSMDAQSHIGDRRGGGSGQAGKHHLDPTTAGRSS